MIILFTKNFAILIFLVAIINAIPINFFIFQILDTDKRVVLNKVSFRWFKFPWNIIGSSARILRFCLIFWNCNKLLTKWLVESCLWRVLDESSICNGVYWMYWMYEPLFHSNNFQANLQWYHSIKYLMPHIEYRCKCSICIFYVFSIFMSSWHFLFRAKIPYYFYSLYYRLESNDRS